MDRCFLVASTMPMQRHHSPNRGDKHQPMNLCQVPQTRSLIMTLGAITNLAMQGRISPHMPSRITRVLRSLGSQAMCQEEDERLASTSLGLQPHKPSIREVKGKFSALSVGLHHQVTIMLAGNARQF